jgi:hypothetical protein
VRRQQARGDSRPSEHEQGDGDPVHDRQPPPQGRALRLGRGVGNASFYIFVDDLDRCSPAIVADTIEAVNLFLTKAFGPCNFVLALDPATVAAHLETAHPSIQERAMDDPVSFGHLRHTGWRFMEKIVDLPIRLPRIPDAAISNYLNELLNAGLAGQGALPVAAETAERALASEISAA